LPCRFDWVQEVERAQALIASGEAGFSTDESSELPLKAEEGG